METYVKEGKAHYQEQRFMKAEDCFRRALERSEKRNPNKQILLSWPEIRVQQALCYFHEGQVEEAIRRLLAIMKTRTGPDKDAEHFLNASYLLAQLYLRTNRLDLAKTFCMKAISGYKRILGLANRQEDSPEEQLSYYKLLAVLSAVHRREGKLVEADINKAMIPGQIFSRLVPYVSIRGEDDFPEPSRVPPASWTGPTATIQWRVAVRSESHTLSEKILSEVRTMDMILEPEQRSANEKILTDRFCDTNGVVDNESAFLWAAELGHSLLILSLIQNSSQLGFKVQWTLNMWNQALRRAATNSHKATAALLLKEPIHKHAKDDALLRAAKYGSTDMVELLLESGAMIRSRSLEQTNDALYMAVVGGHSVVVELLLNACANPKAEIDARRYATNTLLEVAAARGYEETVKVLLDRGADINEVSGNHCNKGYCQTVLHFVIREAPCGDAKKNVILLLLSRGASVTKDSEQKYPQDYIKWCERDLYKLFPPGRSPPKKVSSKKKKFWSF